MMRFAAWLPPTFCRTPIITCNSIRCLFQIQTTVSAMWKFYALLSALFAALTAIFAKIGVANVNAHLATAIRTTVVLLLAWGIVFASGHAGELKGVGARAWVFLILSGLATGLSWIFYFHALQTGDASRVAPIDKLSVVFTILLAFLILREPLTPRVILGACSLRLGA